MSTHTDTAPAGEAFDVHDPRHTKFDLLKEGARRDGVEIVHYAPRFPVVGTKAERRIERTIAFLFFLAFLGGMGFVVTYIWWPWRYESGAAPDVLSKLYTPLLGVSLGLALLSLGMGIVAWSKKLMPEEVSVQVRHDGQSPRDEQILTAVHITNMGEELGVKRRPLVMGALTLAALPLGLAAAAPIVGAMIKDPHNKDDNLFDETGWDPKYNNGQPVRLTREDGTPIKPEEISVGGQITVFPGIPGGATNDHADSPTLLIHLREADAKTARDNAANNTRNRGSQWGNYVAYSKICTHAGCPASLYEQQTNRLLCPCHQSQFQITDNARPIFGPASRGLPQLPIDVDGEGYFIAKSDYKVQVGPAYWERP